MRHSRPGATIERTVRLGAGRAEHGADATMSAATPLCLVRHAQPLVEPGVCYGVLDVAADVADTLRAANALAKGLREVCSAG